MADVGRVHPAPTHESGHVPDGHARPVGLHGDPHHLLDTQPRPLGDLSVRHPPPPDAGHEPAQGRGKAVGDGEVGGHLDFVVSLHPVPLQALQLVYPVGLITDWTSPIPRHIPQRGSWSFFHGSRRSARLFPLLNLTISCSPKLIAPPLLRTGATSFHCQQSDAIAYLSTAQ